MASNRATAAAWCDQLQATLLRECSRAYLMVLNKTTSELLADCDNHDGMCSTMRQPSDAALWDLGCRWRRDHRMMWARWMACNVNEGCFHGSIHFFIQVICLVIIDINKSRVDARGLWLCAYHDIMCVQVWCPSTLNETTERTNVHD